MTFRPRRATAEKEESIEVRIRSRRGPSGAQALRAGPRRDSSGVAKGTPLESLRRSGAQSLRSPRRSVSTECAATIDSNGTHFFSRAWPRSERHIYDPFVIFASGVRYAESRACARTGVPPVRRMPEIRVLNVRAIPVGIARTAHARRRHLSTVQPAYLTSARL